MHGDDPVARPFVDEQRVVVFLRQLRLRRVFLIVIINRPGHRRASAAAVHDRETRRRTARIPDERGLRGRKIFHAGVVRRIVHRMQRIKKSDVARQMRNRRLLREGRRLGRHDGVRIILGRQFLHQLVVGRVGFGGTGLRLVIRGLQLLVFRACGEILFRIRLVVAARIRPAEKARLLRLHHRVESARPALRIETARVRPHVAPIQHTRAWIDGEAVAVARALHENFRARPRRARREQVAFGNRVSAVRLRVNARDAAAQVVHVRRRFL